MNIQIDHHVIPQDAAISAPFAGLVMLLLLLAVSTAKALELLSARELSSHCAFIKDEPDGVDATYCIRYIQGFIDGAVATDVNVMLNVEAAPDSRETFTQRAMRTRAPSSADQHRAAQLAGFCLGEPLPLRDVVNVVVTDLQVLPNGQWKDATAMEFVYASLQRHYPCTS